MFNRVNKLKFSLILGIVGLLLLAACTTTNAPNEEEASEPTAQEPAAVEETVEEEPTTPAEPTEPPPTEEPSAEVEEEAMSEETAETASTETNVIIGDDRSPRLQSLTANWGTDWTRRTISTDEILSGGPPPRRHSVD